MSLVLPKFYGMWLFNIHQIDQKEFIILLLFVKDELLQELESVLSKLRLNQIWLKHSIRYIPTDSTDDFESYRSIHIHNAKCNTKY